jgi:23S rRNA (cytidine1920-2'-O)/16S rRNA (cytidine1409-2'-O)-methyltransferase
MEKSRLDLALVARGLMDTRAQARAAIEAGLVQVNGQSVTRPAFSVKTGDAIVAEAAHPWVSRAGLKLARALEVFGVDPSGMECLDLGASTGGFTQVLLAHGAARVTAVDVGHGQFHPSLRNDPRVVLKERTDARALGAPDLPAPPALITADLSFIGLAKVLPHVLPLAAPGAQALVLVKPQFEAGPQLVGRGGLVDPDVSITVAHEVRASLDGLCGFAAGALEDSPVQGGDGNREFLLHLRRVG